MAVEETTIRIRFFSSSRSITRPAPQLLRIVKIINDRKRQSQQA